MSNAESWSDMVLVGGEKQFSPRGIRKSLHNGKTCQYVRRLLTGSIASQLAVCRGLVLDKWYRLTYARNAILRRMCKANYGIRSRNLVAHRRQLLKSVDEYDCSWLVFSDHPLPRDRPITRSIVRRVRCDLGRPISWDNTIVKSTNGDVIPVTDFKSEVPGALLYDPPPEIRYKAARAFPQREAHWKLKLELRVYAGDAGLRFEMWCGGQRIGQTTDPITVNWIYPNVRRGNDLRHLATNDGAIVEREEHDLHNPRL